MRAWINRLPGSILDPALIALMVAYAPIGPLLLLLRPSDYITPIQFTPPSL
jgi:hypothetical protein